MTQQNPFIPSSELVGQWMGEVCHNTTPTPVSVKDMHIAIRAAEWGRQHGAAQAAADVATDPAPATEPPLEESSTHPPVGSLAERIMTLLGHYNDGTARGVILEVAAWLRTGRMLHAAELLEHEADR
jgi:hypothetical protein